MEDNILGHRNFRLQIEDMAILPDHNGLQVPQVASLFLHWDSPLVV